MTSDQKSVWNWDLSSTNMWNKSSNNLNDFGSAFIHRSSRNEHNHDGTLAPACEARWPMLRSKFDLWNWGNKFKLFKNNYQFQISNLYAIIKIYTQLYLHFVKNELGFKFKLLYQLLLVKCLSPVIGTWTLWKGEGELNAKQLFSTRDWISMTWIRWISRQLVGQSDGSYAY